MQTKLVLHGIEIAGHTYNVTVADNGTIEQTECVGHWPMSDCATGSSWLDAQLQKAVDARIDSFDEPTTEIEESTKATLHPRKETTMLTIEHNSRFTNAVLRVDGLTVCTVQNAIVWIDEFGIMIAKYGDNLPSMSFVASHFARYEIVDNTLTMHIDKQPNLLLPLICK